MNSSINYSMIIRGMTLTIITMHLAATLKNIAFIRNYRQQKYKSTITYLGLYGFNV